MVPTMTMKTYDIVVVGSGPAAGLVAKRCRRAGRTVAMVDKRPFAGTCGLRGCVPKKALVGVAEAVERTRLLHGKGVGAVADLHWPDLMAHKRGFTEPITGSFLAWLDREGIDHYPGKAVFVGPAAPSSTITLDVDGQLLRGGHVHLACGSTPRDLGIPGQELLTISDDFLELDDLPGRVVFVGGGYISMEFAHLAASVGADVTVLHRGPEILKGFDADLAAMLRRASEARGVTVVTGAETTAVEQGDHGLVVTAGGVAYPCDMAVHGAGRVPDVADMGLDVARVESSGRGIRVNGFMQTTNPRVYAAGDCADTPYDLTPSATMQAAVAVQNILGGDSTPVDFTGVPAVCFTVPRLAGVGLTEAQAQAEGLDVTVSFKDTTGDFENAHLGELAGAYKVIWENDTDRIVGAHLLGHGAEETINVFAMAMRLGLSRGRLKEAVWVYPSLTYEIQYMLD